MLLGSCPIDVVVLNCWVTEIAHLLRNRFYIGEVAFKGEVLAGEQPAIIDRDLFDAVQAKLSEQVTNHKVSRTGSEALLLGRIFDDRGHRMSPSHVRKRAIKYRYYLSSALLQGRPKQAGTVSRIPAREVETLIANAVRNHLRQPPESRTQSLSTPMSSGLRFSRINSLSNLPVPGVPNPNGRKNTAT